VCPVKNNGGTEKGRKGVLVVGQLPLEGECTNVVEGTHP